MAAVLASRPPSMVRRHLALLSPRPAAESRFRSLLITHELSRSGLGWSEIDLLRAKVVAALLAAALVAVVGLVIPIGPAFVVAAAYAGFVTPTVYVERAASRCRARAYARPGPWSANRPPRRAGAFAGLRARAEPRCGGPRRRPADAGSRALLPACAHAPRRHPALPRAPRRALRLSMAKLERNRGAWQGAGEGV